MKIIFLGQNGILIESKKSTFVIDPYLSDSVAKTEPQNVRRQKIDERFLKIKPDVVLITHSHADHYDEETLDAPDEDDDIFGDDLFPFVRGNQR